MIIFILDLRLKVEYHRTVLEVQKLRSLYNLKGTARFTIIMYFMLISFYLLR